MTAIVDRSSLPARATLYRGTFDSPELVDQLRAAHASGDVWTEPGFMSTSLVPDQAETFYDSGDPAESVAFEIQVDAPQGAKAFVFDGALEGMPNVYDQQEVLLQRGSRFHLDSLTTDTEGMLHVKMRLLPPGEDGA